MVTGYRFTEDEFVFLAYFYQCMTVPAWFLCEPEQIDPEKALRTLERKGMLLKNGGKNTPHPVIDLMADQRAVRVPPVHQLRHVPEADVSGLKLLVIEDTDAAPARFGVAVEREVHFLDAYEVY